MARTWKNEKRPTWSSPSHWLKEWNRPYRTRSRQLIRNGKTEEIPTSFGAYWKRNRRGWYW